MISFKRSLTAGLALSLGFIFTALLPQGALADGKTLLRGQVDKEGYRQPADNSAGGVSGPSLSRRDIEKRGDPFSGHAEASAEPNENAQNVPLDAPPEAFQGASIKPKPSFGLHADDEGGGNFNGQGMPGVPDRTALLPQDAAPRTFMPIDQDPNLADAVPQTGMVGDPDNTPDMQLAWDIWHHRVAEAIFERFKFFANKAFAANPMLVARVSYVVTRDGRIGNLTFAQKSPNIMFNALIVQCIKSINGDKALLEFPQGSRRMTVDKFGQFDMAGRGAFRYTVGDREVIPGMQNR
jgi:hypothetical protein